MDYINKNNCCLFKSNPNINPVTNNPLTIDEKKEWISKCSQYMYEMKDEKIENLKNVDIYSPRKSDIISMAHLSKEIPKSPAKIRLKKSQKPPLPGQSVIPVSVSKPIIKPVEVGYISPNLPLTTIQPKISDVLEKYYKEINSDLVFNYDILNKLRITDLKYIIKNNFKNISNYIKKFNSEYNNNLTLTKILLNKENMIQLIEFMKKDDYKYDILPNINDIIYQIFIDNKLSATPKIKNLFDEYLERKKEKVILMKQKEPISYDKLTGIELYNQFNEENINNDVELLKYRAKYINSDNFLDVLNINSINNDSYKTKYNDKNFIFIIKLFSKFDPEKLPQISGIPDNVFKLLFFNNNVNEYNDIANNIFSQNNNNMNLYVFQNILKEFLKFIMKKPYNKYIPSNLNKYIKKQISSTIITETLPSTSTKRSLTTSKKGTSPNVTTYTPAQKYFYSRGKYEKPKIQREEELYRPISPPNFPPYKETAPEEIEEIYKPISPPTLYPTEPSSPPYVPVSPPSEYYKQEEELRKKQEERLQKQKEEIKRKREEIIRKREKSVSPPYVPTTSNLPEISTSIYEKPPMSEYTKKIYKIKTPEKQKRIEPQKRIESFEENKKLNYQELKNKWKSQLNNIMKKNPSLISEFIKSKKIVGKSFSQFTKPQYLDLLVYLKLIE